MNYKVYLGIALVLILILLYCKTRSENFGGSSNSAQNNYKLVLYYTNWCGWSQKFLPTWDELKKQVKNVDFVDIDCENNKDQCQNIPGFPYLVLENVSSNKIQYKGDRTIEDLKKFLEKNTQ